MSERADNRCHHEQTDLVLAITLESVPALWYAKYARLFLAIELLSLIVFTVEYRLRIWVAVEHSPYRHLSARKARWKFIRSPLGIIDFLAVLPFWFAFALPADLRVLLVFLPHPRPPRIRKQ